MTCVLEALKEVFISVGYTIDSFSLHSDSGLIEIVLHFKLGAGGLKNPQGGLMALDVGGGG